MNAFGLAALVVFFGCFLAIVVWTWTRPRREIDAQAQLPLEDDD
jgi:cbb3-type cytochrome oxidase subunit 3